MPMNNNQSAVTTINLPTLMCEETNTLRANRRCMMKYFLSLFILAALLVSMQAQADESGAERSARAKKEIDLVIQEIYWRVKAQDYTVFWENELTYFQEENPLPEYLAQRQFIGPDHASGDNTVSTFLDSVTIVGDTALAHLTTSVLTSQGDTGKIYTPQTLLYEAGRWKKAMSSTTFENDQYFENIKKYREAAESESAGK